VAEPRYSSIEAYLQAQPEPHRETLASLITMVEKHFPGLELTLASNVPHFTLGKAYVAGLSTLKNYVAFSPWSEAVMDANRDSLGTLESTKNLIRIPLGWTADEDLVVRLVQARLAELV